MRNVRRDRSPRGAERAWPWQRVLSAGTYVSKASPAELRWLFVNFRQAGLLHTNDLVIFDGRQQFARNDWLTGRLEAHFELDH